MMRHLVVTMIAVLNCTLVSGQDAAKVVPAPPLEVLPNTSRLETKTDIASDLVDGVDRFLLNQLNLSVERRPLYWKRDFSSAANYVESIEPNRRRLAHILGLREARVPFENLEIISTVQQDQRAGTGNGFDIYVVRWPAIADVTAEGLLLVPQNNTSAVDVVAIPDASQTPEQICGLVSGVAPASQFARRLAEGGCRVLVPMIIDRELKPRAPPGRSGGARISNREFVYRSAFELGRHLIGYELQKVLAGIDWFEQDRQRNSAQTNVRRVGVAGYGEGGMLALYAAALDPRIDVCCVSGHFGPREEIWNQPLDRNVFGLLEQFGDAELASLVTPRSLVIDAFEYPTLELPSQGGAPAQLKPVPRPAVTKEIERFQALIKLPSGQGELRVRDDRGESDAWYQFTELLFEGTGQSSWKDPAKAAVAGNSIPKWSRKPLDVAARHDRQFREMDRHSQQVLRESEYVRADFMKKLNTSSVEKYQETVEEYRSIFRNDVIGAFDLPLLPPKPRSRKAYEGEKWVGYEVVIDVWPDVIAFGVLLLPKDLKENEKRPVVVCQHGLEGRPADVLEKDHPAYHDFAAKLCERGFITFAPQNLYIFRDRFRTLQRKANPLKKTLFSLIVPQHQQIVDWLKSLPYVDSERIAFYGLSYGGKSAMRIPPLVTDYCLSICSADFNEWVAKNASTRLPFSYMWTGEYEIFEFDLGSTFNYAEMAALICPKPFMVERGHTDGVSNDECVAYEFAKVRFLYSHRLKIPDRVEMEVFDGPHTINGKGTFEFLHKHLKWPVR